MTQTTYTLADMIASAKETAKRTGGTMGAIPASEYKSTIHKARQSVLACLSKASEPLNKSDIQRRTKRAISAIRHAIADLLESGHIEGVAPTHQRGGALVVYQVKRGAGITKQGDE